MLINIVKMLKAFVLAYVALDLLGRLYKKIYTKISTKPAEQRWAEYLAKKDLSAPIDQIKQTIN